MASTPLHRRPLATLNSNHAPTPHGSRNVSQTFKGATKPEFMEKTLFSATLGGKASGEVEQDDRLDGGKRNHSDDDYDVRTNKRQRKTEIVEESQIQQHDQAQSREVARTLEEDEFSSDHAENKRDVEQTGSSLLDLMLPSSESPSSQLPSDVSSGIASPMATVNESQNTTITVPDDDIHTAWLVNSPSNIAPRSLTAQEIRQKAKEIRLRLSLANYKVRTNQIDVPISRLQIRSSPFSSRKGISGASSTSRTPLPSTSIPNINLQKVSAEKNSRISGPFSPPSHNFRLIQSQHLSSPVKQKDDIPDGLSTPLLPRQREGLLNPPILGSPEEHRLTSSVVKGRAADGLLSLMRHQD